MSTPDQPPYGPYGQPGPPPQGQPPYGGPQGQPGQPPYGQQPPPGFTPPNYGQQRPGGYPTPPSPGGYYPNQPGHPNQPGYGPQPGAPGRPPAKSSGARIGLIVGAIVLALIIIGVGAAVLVDRSGDSASDPVDPTATAGTGGGPTSGPSGGASTLAPPPVSTKADQSVKAYLEALAGGQAAVALSLAKDQPADRTFLTDAVLADSNTRAPITAITVTPPDSEYDTSIEASYKIGEQQVNESFTVQKVGDNYLLYNVAQDVNVETIRARTLPLAINGVEVTADDISLFPGSYVLDSGTEYISYGKGTLVVKSPSDYPNAYDLRPEITEAGTQAFAAAAKAKLAACLKEAKLKPAGCPFLNIRNLPGQKLTASTIKRRITEDPFSNVKPRLDYQDPAVAEAGITVRWSATARGTQDGRSSRFEINDATDYTNARAKMTGDQVKVSFSA